jgi:hypothetical protein
VIFRSAQLRGRPAIRDEDQAMAATGDTWEGRPIVHHLVSTLGRIVVSVPERPDALHSLTQKRHRLDQVHGVTIATSRKDPRAACVMSSSPPLSGQPWPGRSMVLGIFLNRALQVRLLPGTNAYYSWQIRAVRVDAVE